ncbi:uncharacterized protein LOC124541719 [Vanessa cardui]|uniref:uncharacterized protein LOC124541719 n=1 Tax=Vanessa cardui TaxID=171605 RepID=UPI001F12A818|nr:uncharacterized protein LOC124541719 [Vanessa cardui]
MLVKDASVQVGISGALFSGFIFFISAMGLYGALTGSQFLLFMYGTLVILLMLLECALIYYFSSNITEKGLEQDGFISDSLRIQFRCCDQNNTTPATVPWSCCDVIHSGNCTTDNIYKNDCRTEFILWLNKYQTVIYATVAVVHILLSSCSLLRRSSSSRSDT